MVPVQALFRFPRELLQFVFPPLCGACGGRLNPREESLCEHCREQLVPLSPPFCECCGEPLKLSARARPQHLCRRCGKTPLFLERARSAYQFEEPARSLIHHFKFSGRTELARPMAAMMVNAWLRWLDERPFDALIPVPLHATRRRQRGFNQSELLAREFSRFSGMRAAPFVLLRTRPTKAQTSLAFEKRWENVRGAFSVEQPDAINGKALLLIDDVATTCATGNACAEALVQAGAASVTLLTFARAG